MAMSNGENIPREITDDIFTRLPAKSIGQSRCVSKQWCSLLSDPQFIKAHLTSYSNQEQEKLIFVSGTHSLHTITFNPQNGNDGISRKLNFDKLKDNWVTVGGSCNGLVLVVNKKDNTYLINPTTLKYRVIPNFHLPLSDEPCKSMYGLGYDVVSDDYKVVILSYSENGRYIFKTFVDVYSVRKGIWRRLESSPYDHALPVCASGVLVNGALHWLVCTAYSRVIAAFNLGGETFLEVPPPPTLDKNKFIFIKLAAFGGCLCLFMRTDGDKVDVWMMEEYGVEDSWTKFEVRGPGDVVDLRPLCLISEDDVLLDAGKELFVYNVRKDQWRNMMVDGIPTMLGNTGTGTCRESLVSPTLG